MKTSNNIFRKRKRLGLLFLFVFLSFSLLGPVKALAGADIIGGPTTVVRKVLDDVKDKRKDWFKKIGTKIFQSTLSTALNKLAYDAATYIGTGGQGQSALFTTDYFTDYAKDLSNAAFGTFVDSLSKRWQVDLCQPTLGFKINIGLGLVAFQEPEFKDTNCDLQTYVKNWASFTSADRWESFKDGGYLSALADSFNPTSNDVMLTLEIFDRAKKTQEEEKEKQKTQITTNSGWLDVRSVSDRTKGVPNQGEKGLIRAQESQDKSLAVYTGNAALDAANIFLNQLAITGFNNIVKKLGDLALRQKASQSSSISYASDSGSYSSGNYVVSALKAIVKPRFNVGADLDVLSTLAVCADENNPAPNNCVIDNNFSQAIQNKNTVIEAIDNGYLNGEWIFDPEASYQSGFNYRSLLTLKKFRIIPVGWEEAFTRSLEKSNQTGNKYTLMDMVSCFNPNDEYENFSSGFLQSEFSSYSWCEGLIDPDWVLKAPLSYCKRQGYGGYILTQQLVNVSTELADQNNIAPIVISRSEDYCADEQSCIKEKSDGTCQYYGYCTEEKRSWNFGENSCEAVFNTCESFTSSSNGKKLALLKNTIDYGECGSNNVGCAKYSLSGRYNSEADKVDWDGVNSIYLNNQAASCSAANEGCQELIRTTAGSGHNFIINGNFEDDLSRGDWGNIETSTTAAYNSETSMVLGSGNSLEKTITVAPSNQTISGESYTLSFYSYCNGQATASLGPKSLNIATSSGFIYNAITYTFPNNYSSNNVTFSFNVEDGPCYFDFIKLERGIVGTYYSDYRSKGLIYEKMIPDYLKEACYEDPYSANPNYKLKEEAPSSCFQYARLCGADEMACELFTSVYGIKLAAKALDKDYCPEQCVGYDIYVQKNTLFEDKIINKFIPSSAQACSASAAGCTEFTNLDEIAAGGEGREYYTYLRQCIKPDQGSCSDFYSWEGSDESGYQLRSFSFEKQYSSDLPVVTDGEITGDPASANNSIASVYYHINQSGAPLCNQDIYHLPVSDPNYNPDCREFYNRAGHLIYALYTKTKTCSNDCKTYRMTEKNIDSSVNNSTACVSSNDQSSHWDSLNQVCYRCLSGGVWNDDQSACLYKAIPGEGQTCSASSNGCREYNGNSGNRVQIISTFDFTSHNLNAWNGELSSESLNQNGSSMKISRVAQVNLQPVLRRGSSYIIRFMAKNTVEKKLSISLYNGSERSFFSPVGEDNSQYSLIVPANSSWQLYQVNLPELDHNVSQDESLNFKIEGNGGEIYISSIILLEVSSRYYLIQDSWSTPNICYYDTLGNYQGVNYNLSCQKYTDRNNTTRSLRQFSSLCDSSAVGCELMIKTNNSDDPSSTSFNCNNTEDQSSCFRVEADQFIVATYDSGKFCSADNKGCSRLGQVMTANPYSTSQNVYQDTYLKIDPNNFDRTLCQADKVGCDAWSAAASAGTSYFKDPGDNVCQWRRGSATASGYAWYKKAVKKCKINDNTFSDNLCLSNDDCLPGQECKLDEGDYLCPVEFLKTINSDGGAIYQPASSSGVYWAGLCPIAQAGCTEYLDPLSSFNPNLILNPYFYDLNSDGTPFDYWEAPSGGGDIGQTCSSNSSGEPSCSDGYFIRYQEVSLSPNKLYIFETKGQQQGLLECDQSIYVLNDDNDFVKMDLGYALNASSTNSKRIFYSADNDFCRVTYFNPNVPGNILIMFNQRFSRSVPSSFLAKLFNLKTAEAENDDPSLELREVAVDHQLKQNLNFNQCNGQANLSQGCVLFNERSYQFNPLMYNSLNYPNYSASDQAQDANTLIKVSPNRVCGQWLSCLSYLEENGEKVCLELGECSAFNSDGSCYNFTKAPEGKRTFTPGRDDNASGYSVLGLDYLAKMKQVGGGEISFDFEKSDSLSDWTIYGHIDGNTISTTNCWINRPNAAGLIGNRGGSQVSYPASGIGFVKVKGDNNCGNTPNNYLLSKDISLEASDYYLSALVDTSDLPSGQTAKISIFNGNATLASYSVPAKQSWREISFKFTLPSSINVKIGLHTSTSTSPAYFDDIRISPVLQTTNNDIVGNDDDRQVTPAAYLPATCRLYPTDDSLLCASESQNFIANGWYGYCLQKDPKNDKVCLLWYPLDKIRGGQSSFASSAYSGYADTGSKPYYCAEMTADYSIVQQRYGYYITKSNNPETGSNQDVHVRTTATPMPPNLYCGEYGTSVEVKYKTVNNNCDNCYNLSYYCIPQRKGGAAVVACSKRNNTCGSVSISENSDYNILKYRSREEGTISLTGNGYDMSVANLESAAESRGWTILQDDSNVIIIYNSDGYYSYLSDPLISKGFGSPVILDYSNQNHPEIKSIENYHPKCTKIVQGIIPWVDRLYNSGKSIKEYNDSNEGHLLGQQELVFKHYKLGLSGSPFGAIVTNGRALSSVVYAGHIEDSTKQYGFPYFCKDGNHGNVNIKHGTSFESIKPCEALYFKYNNSDPEKISVAVSSEEIEGFDGGGSIGYGDFNYWHIFNYQAALRHLFLKANQVFGSDDDISYDFTSSIPQCSDNIRTPDTAFCAIYPQATNIKMTNNLNNPLTPTDNVFKVTKPGFYNISFNTIVDPEQVPISEITFRVFKKDTDKWTDKTGIYTHKNLDPKPETNEPHRFGFFLSSGDYILAVKVKDNWTKYGCASPGKDFSPNSNCAKCCHSVNNNEVFTFMDYTEEGQILDNCSTCF